LNQDWVGLQQMSPTVKLGDVMSCLVDVATLNQRLGEIDALFATQSGLPVVDSEGRCIGVISKKDKARASNGVSAPPPPLPNHFLSACHYLQLLLATPVYAWRNWIISCRKMSNLKEGPFWLE
jgi:hypothetical protein